MMKKWMFFVVAVVMVLVAGCKDDSSDVYDDLSPRIYNDTVFVSYHRAVFRWSVDFPGRFASVVEVGSSEMLHGGYGVRYGSEAMGGARDFEVVVDGLDEGQCYYFRYEVWNENAGWRLALRTFETLAHSADTVDALDTVATVVTMALNAVGTTWAMFLGEVTDDGGAEVTERGFCWSTREEPTLSDSVVRCDGGNGYFTAAVSNLTENTTYYFRTYAVNRVGTAYGEVIGFTTLDRPPAPIGSINGLFSINFNGDQVFFSQGNLQFQASTHTWRFAKKQWDYVGANNHNISQTYDGWIDLFGWGTSGFNHGANCYQPWSTSQTKYNYCVYGQSDTNLNDQTGQADWGYNAINNGGNQTGQWRTLSYEEWMFVFCSRQTPSQIRYAMANLIGVNGVILLPDDWDSSYYCFNHANQSDAEFSSNTISSIRWADMEQHGAVFLPAAGYRKGTSVSGVGYYGCYWSATHYDTYNALCVRIPNLFFRDAYRYYGQSVRLVRPVQKLFRGERYPL